METKIKYLQGNLLNSTAAVIGHQTNCKGVMGGGVAKQIKAKWPIVFTAYSDFCFNKACIAGSNVHLGKCQLVPISVNRFVANLFGQDDHNATIRQTNYEAIYTALEALSNSMKELNLHTVAFPYKLSSGLAGAEWTIIEAMIKFLFKDFDVEIWEYKG
jgi:O-acetyl-ADP-ribose deacetylase (regulator of RNase III)